MAISNSAVFAEVKVHRQLHGSSSKCGRGLAHSRSRHSAAWKGEGNQYVPIKRGKMSLTSCGVLESSAAGRRTFSPVWGGNILAQLQQFSDHGCLGKVKEGQGALITGLRGSEEYSSVHQSESPRTTPYKPAISLNFYKRA